MKHTFLLFFLLPFFSIAQIQDRFDSWSDQKVEVTRSVEGPGYNLAYFAEYLGINGYRRILYKETTCPPFVINGSLWDAEHLSFQKDSMTITIWRSYATTTWISCYADRPNLCVEQSGRYYGVTMGRIKKKEKK